VIAARALGQRGTPAEEVGGPPVQRCSGGTSSDADGGTEGRRRSRHRRSGHRDDSGQD
jgi:hypothetical protein